jgi:hypothetical protein
VSTLSPTQHAKLRSLVEGFDAAIERERTLWGAPSAERMRARGVGLADVNARLDHGISLRDVHALTERGLLQVATARTSASGLRRGSFGRWLGGSVQRELVTARVTPTEEGRRQIAATEVAIMADQLWVVFVDGVAQTGVLPYARSEDVALRLWREQTGHGELARERLRVVPKAEVGIDDTDVLDSAGAGVRREPISSSRSEELTNEEEAALHAWAAEQGRTWKAALRDAWDTGNYGGSEHDAELQRIRNKLGPSWLVKYRLPVDPSAVTTGYRCWVRTSIKPNETRVWVATRRPDALSQVRAAVRNNKSEGGVESQDPDKPYDVTFAMVRGKLTETKHTD